MFTEQKEQTWVEAMGKVDDSKFQIIEVKINPYAYIVDSGFEEANKDVIINHTVYHVFKNRIQNNVLKLYCLKMAHQIVVNKSIINIVDNQLNDANSNNGNPIKKLLKSYLKDYIHNNLVVNDFAIKNVFGVRSFYKIIKNELLDGFLTTHSLPPNLV